MKLLTMKKLTFTRGAEVGYKGIRIQKGDKAFFELLYGPAPYLWVGIGTSPKDAMCVATLTGEDRLRELAQAILKKVPKTRKDK